MYKIIKGEVRKRLERGGGGRVFFFFFFLATASTRAQVYIKPHFMRHRLEKTAGMLLK